MNCSLGALGPDRGDELPASAVATGDLAGAAICADNLEAEDRGAEEEAGRPRVNPGMLPMGKVKSVRRLGISTTCNSTRHVTDK